jgi:hypothetical protein
MGADVEYLQYLECADKLYFTMKMQLRVNFLSLIGSKPFFAAQRSIIVCVLV